MPIHAAGAAIVPPKAMLKPGWKNNTGNPAEALTEPCASAAAQGLLVFRYNHEKIVPSRTQNTTIMKTPATG